MRNSLVLFAALALPVAVFASGAAFAQGGGIGNWTTAGADPSHSGWQKNEKKISKETAGTQFKFLWKLKLGATAKETQSFTEPLLALRLINAQGFKDLVLWGSTDTVYAVDSELGTIVWKKTYDVPASNGTGACGAHNLSIVMEPPVVINFGAHRAPGASPAPTPPASAPPLPLSQRRLGVTAGGGGFGLKGLYVLTGDGILHEQVLSTGIDFAPPVKFLPMAHANPDGLSVIGKKMFTITGRGCSGTKNGLWAIDLASPDYTTTNYMTDKVVPLGLSGPTLDDGVAYLVTGSGAAGNVHADSVIAVTVKDMKEKDWYMPAGEGKVRNISPVAFTFKQKKLVAAPGRDGSFVLLDSESLGGADHHTPLSESAKIAKTKSDSFDSLASWQDASGTAWVLASVSGSLLPEAKFAATNGPAPHGSVVAFKVEEKGDKMMLTPAWVSRDLIHPAPPVITNGVVVALSQGNSTMHATLYVLDAMTGKELYSSKDAISTYAHLTGVAVGDGHAFFTTHDSTLYSFGIGLEH
ncbi:pyrrolo-quinoline quinone [Terriglobus saanensis]|uniref:Pyrrolo-quinoline quinone n=1 Tax=Terriglobus saanensis (strain ATCC BAA-1853 / DSM 23119 / SP1PR4) TaxID=401053 RepID=E8UYD7_TERSS|nr:pyrrolo-quinoline quinone [Terriglobus saanensis]ADV82025.1 pyrrolo-quinoline quinone [Terriglobus saanensis SP1PR4]